MAGYFAEIWRCRYFWMALVRMDLRTRYRRSVLGLGWSLLHPLLMMTILCFVFHRLFNADIADYAPFLLTGLACWQYLVSVTTLGSDCFFAAELYIRQSPAPLAIFPLRTALGGTVHFLIALGLAAGLSFLFNGISNPLALATLVPAIALFFVLVWSLALLAGIGTVLFHDVRNLIEVGFQVFFYLTPILYPPRILNEHGLNWVIQLNPLVAFLHLIRDPILYGRCADWSHWGVAAGAVTVAALLAAGALARVQKRLIFYL